MAVDSLYKMCIAVVSRSPLYMVLDKHRMKLVPISKSGKYAVALLQSYLPTLLESTEGNARGVITKARKSLGQITKGQMTTHNVAAHIFLLQLFLYYI